MAQWVACQLPMQTIEGSNPATTLHMLSMISQWATCECIRWDTEHQSPIEKLCILVRFPCGNVCFRVLKCEIKHKSNSNDFHRNFTPPLFYLQDPTIMELKNESLIDL